MSVPARRVQLIQGHVVVADEVRACFSRYRCACLEKGLRFFETSTSGFIFPTLSTKCPDLTLHTLSHTQAPESTSSGLQLQPTAAVAVPQYAVPLPERLSDGEFHVYRCVCVGRGGSGGGEITFSFCLQVSLFWPDEWGEEKTLFLVSPRSLSSFPLPNTSRQRGRHCHSHHSSVHLFAPSSSSSSSFSSSSSPSSSSPVIVVARRRETEKRKKRKNKTSVHQSSLSPHAPHSLVPDPLTSCAACPPSRAQPQHQQERRVVHQADDWVRPTFPRRQDAARPVGEHVQP